MGQGRSSSINQDRDEAFTRQFDPDSPPQGNGDERLERLEAGIRRTEAQIEKSLEKLDEMFTFESLSQAAVAKGKELMENKLRPYMTEMGESMKEVIEKSMETIKRNPVPVMLMGVGAGLVLLSVFGSRKPGQKLAPEQSVEDGQGEQLEFEGSAEKESGSDMRNAIPLGLSALVVGAVISGMVPGLDFESPRLREWKSELLEKAGQAGQEILRSTEKMLREKFQPETAEEQEPVQRSTL